MKKVIGFISFLTILVGLFFTGKIKDFNRKGKEANSVSLLSEESSRSKHFSQKRDWNEIRKKLQADLERPQDEVPWNTIEPLIKALLEEDEQQTLQLLAGLSGNVNHYALRLYLEDYYIASKNSYKGLKALEVLQSNLTLNSPLVEKFVEVHAKQHFEEAHDWLVQHSTMSGIESAAVALGFIAGGKSDPVNHFEKMISSDIPENIRPAYLQGLMQAWVKNDFDGALLHLSEAELTEELDPAIYSLVTDLSRIDPESTMLWVEMIKNQGLRLSAVLETARTWAETEPASYFEWKKHVELPQEYRIELP